MSRQVTYAKLQTPYFSPNSGELGVVFPPAGKTLSELSMNTSPEGLMLKFRYAGRNQEILVPYANIVGMTLAPIVESK
jgi:hypothetical protein